MRHRLAGKHLSRTSAHRSALRRNLAASLFEHGTISTTREKAKFVKPFAEKLITLAKDGSLHARRRVIALLQDRDICKVENGQPVRQTTVIRKLFSEIGPQFQDRNGGYTRIINLPLRRIGDNAQQVLLQLVGESKSPSKPKRSRHRGSETTQPPAEPQDQTDNQPEAAPQPQEAAPQSENQAPDEPAADDTEEK